MSEPSEASTREIVGVFPASFDPIHNGHVSIIERAARLTNRLVVAVAVNPVKRGQYEFGTDERITLVEKSIAHVANTQIVETEAEPEVVVVSGLGVAEFIGGLTVDHARELGAQTMFRGVRSNTDFEAEIELHLQNIAMQEFIGIKPGHPDFVDTTSLYRLPGEDHMSSSLIRFLMHGEGVQHRVQRIQPLVPEPVFQAILERLPQDS